MRECLLCSNCLSLSADAAEPMRLGPCGHRICPSCLLRVSGPKCMCRFPFCGRLLDVPSLPPLGLTCRDEFEKVMAGIDMGVCRGFKLPRIKICLNDRCVKRGLAECDECLNVSHAHCPPEDRLSFQEILRQMHLEVPDLQALLRVFEDELRELGLPESNGQVLGRKLQGLADRFLVTEPQQFLNSSSGYRLHKADTAVLVTDPILTELEQLVLELHTKPPLTPNGQSVSLEDQYLRSKRIMELIMELVGEKLVTEEVQEQPDLLEWQSARVSNGESEVSRDSVEGLRRRRESSRQQQDYVRMVGSLVSQDSEHRTPQIRPETPPDPPVLEGSVFRVPDEVREAVKLIESRVLDQVRPEPGITQTPEPVADPFELPRHLRNQWDRRPHRCHRRRFRRLLSFSVVALVVLVAVAVVDNRRRSPEMDPSLAEALERMVRLEMDRQQHSLESRVASQVLTQIEYKIEAFKEEIRNEMEQKHAYLNLLDTTLDGAVAKVAELNAQTQTSASEETAVHSPAEQTLGHLFSRISNFFKGKKDLKEGHPSQQPSANATAEATPASILKSRSMGRLFDLLDPILEARMRLVQEEVLKEIRSQFPKPPNASQDSKEPKEPKAFPEAKKGASYADQLLSTTLRPLRESPILSEEQTRFLALLVAERYQSATLLMDSKRDGGSPETFHRLCDNKGPTLVLVKSKDYVAGGLTSVSWSSVREARRDPLAFVFSLTLRQVYRVIEHSQFKAIQCHPFRGPMFTDALEISPMFQTARNWSQLCSTYGQKCQGNSKASLFRENTFEIDRYEVYQLA